MTADTEMFFLEGKAGRLECLLDLPGTAPRGIALLAHPHPLYGGTMTNKVVQIMARAFAGLGYAAARMNFRGVGRTDGRHDGGYGETDDMMVLLDHMEKKYPGLPAVLGGFSFGTFVVSLLQEKLAAAGRKPLKMLLVSTPAGQWSTDKVPAGTILIHGEYDDLAPLSALLDWARPQDLALTLVPGGDHLFNRRLHHIQNIIAANFKLP